MRKTAVIVHLDALEGAVPLVGGYLKAYAFDDPRVRSAWNVELYSASSRTPPSRILRDLVSRAPELVAFSVYVWNAGLVRSLLTTLRDLLPRSRFLLGGVEVLHQAQRFLDPASTDGYEDERLFVCNGEGERTFRGLLLELAEVRPDLSHVAGLTFARDGALVTTEGEPRIQDLSELPSPWLTGVFDDVPLPQVALYETNRGCPFACSFCYWGGAVGQKIYRQDLDRIQDELTWIARKGIPALSISDANFGIFPHDVDIARHIAAISRRHDGISRVVFNSSKVKPERVQEISGIFAEANLLTRHCFSLQSLNEDTLRLAKRTGLEREPYRRIQQSLNEEGLASIVELVWPMPGETLDSFQAGIDELCRAGARAFLVYPLHWLHNTEYRESELDAQVVTMPESDPASGGELVVQTAEVPFEDYLQGLRFSLALHSLKDCAGLDTTMGLLDALGIASYREVLNAFAHFVETRADGLLADAWRRRFESFEELADWAWRGQNAELLLDTERQAFDALLVAFFESQSAWIEHEHAALLREALDYDLATRPYIFLQTPFELGVPLARIQLEHVRGRRLTLRANHDWPRISRALRTGRALDATRLEAGCLEPRPTTLRVDHRRRQLFRMPGQTREETWWLTMQAAQELVLMEPKVTAEAALLAAPDS